MWSSGSEGGGGLVAVAIDKDKNSQSALKWAVDHLVHKAQTVLLIHVKTKTVPVSTGAPRVGLNQKCDTALICRNPDAQTQDMFLPFRCFCSRKDIQSRNVVLEESDVAKALVEYIKMVGIEVVVVGGTTKGGLFRFKVYDIATIVCKNAPDFCSVYVITKGKITSMKSSTRPLPFNSVLRKELLTPTDPREEAAGSGDGVAVRDRPTLEPSRGSSCESAEFRSPLPKRGHNGKSYTDLNMSDTDISFVGSGGRPSVERVFPVFGDWISQEGSNRSGRQSISSDMESVDLGSPLNFNFSGMSIESERLSTSSMPAEDMEAEMRRLKLELKQTMEMYSTACKEALSAKQKTKELQEWKIEERRRLEQARIGEEAALALVEKEKQKSRAAMEAAKAAQRVAELEANKRINAEMKALKESEEKRKALNQLVQTDIRYRKYSIDEIKVATDNFSDSRRIGEGGYGHVFKCNLDHTPVAIKVLRPDAAQGRSQFQQEVEVLSCIRHPNMVLLLGACPEYGCLVYEFMSNGSLDDRLFRRGGTRPLSWQLRFRIAAEIGTALLFLHQTKPEPIVHRDLKPGNILLDQNFVSKIGDVGLARLVPPSVTECVTQYRITSAAGTFCYIDPEYQQTGMLGVKSDVYSLGIMLLQIITAKPPMGLTHHVERAIAKGAFEEMLDPTVTDWPIQEALSFAQMALKCSELRRKDRPDLGKVVLPELNRLRGIAEETVHLTMFPSASSCFPPTTVESPCIRSN